MTVLRKPQRALSLVLAGTIFAGTFSAAAETKSYSVISSGERVGTLTAEIDDRTVSIDYLVRNNGRGPDVEERIELDDDGNIVSWRITGEATFGAAINETFAFQDGVATWVSEPDEGSVRTGDPRLYIGNAASPYALGLYVGAALRDDDLTIPVLPGGMLKLTDLGPESLGGDNGLPVHLYAVGGLGVTPTLVMVDEDGDLAAVLGEGSLTIREGYEDEYGRLTGMVATATREQVTDLQARLSHRYDIPVRYRNVRIYDPRSGTIGKKVSVVVYEDRISSIDPGNAKSRDGAKEVVVDGQGGILMPGYHDFHSHISPWGGLFYIAAGVTSVRDQGGNPERTIEMSRDIEDGLLAGPRIVRNGFIEGRSGYSARVAFIADDLDEAIDAVRWYAEHGYFQIKIYNSIKPEWIAPMAAEARRLGLGVTGHVPAFTLPDQVIEWGYDDIAHINQLMLGWLLEPGEDTRTTLRLTGMQRAAELDLTSPRVKKTIELMKEHGVALDTTAMILERLMLSREREVLAGDAPVLDHMPIGYQRSRKRTIVSVAEPGADQRYNDAFAKILELMKLLDDEGVQLLPGTDDDTGFSVHRELEVYAEAGISNARVLNLATQLGADYLRRGEQVGSIEPGKYADFVLLKNDPLKDIRAVRSIRLVSRGGQIYYPSEIYEALAIEPFFAPPPVSIPAD